MSIPHHSTHLDSLKKLLSQGVSKSDAAATMGITPSAVTQLTQAAQTTAPVVAASNPIDDQYDRIEEKLLAQLERTIPLLMRPMEISRVLTQVNGAKRRGGPLRQESDAPRVLQLNLPVTIQNRFVLNSANQVISAGSQDLVTLPSAKVAKLLEGTYNVPTPTKEQEDEYGFTSTDGS